MKTVNIILIVLGILIISGLIYLISKSNQRESIKQAAINSGIPPIIAINASQSTDPARSLRSLGVPQQVATLISLGTSVNSSEDKMNVVTCVPDCPDDEICIKGACVKKEINNL